MTINRLVSYQCGGVFFVVQRLMWCELVMCIHVDDVRQAPNNMEQHATTANAHQNWCAMSVDRKHVTTRIHTLATPHRGLICEEFRTN